MSTLTSAGVPAFRCRVDNSGPSIVARTPEFMAMMQDLTGQLDEYTLLARLAAAWPADPGDAPFMLGAANLDWQCVLTRFDAPSADYLAIFRVCERLQVPSVAFSTMIDNLPDVVTRHDRHFRCVYANPAIEQLTGISADQHIGRDLRTLFMAEERRANTDSVYQRVFDTGEIVTVDFGYAGPGGLRNYQARAMPEFDHDGRVQTVLSIIRDVTELTQLQQQLERLARTDPLTSLLNRRSFLECAGAALDRARRGHCELSLLMLDVDNMKCINDRFGHAAGDRVLEALSRMLVTETRAQDFVARLGGDEFCIALIDTDATQADAVAERLCRRVNDIAVCDDRSVELSVSVGVTQAGPTDTCAADLIARVDTLMYQAKLRVREMS